MANGLHLRVADLSVEQVDLGRAHQRSFLAGDELDALGRGIRALVKLAGQKLHRQHALAGLEAGQPPVGVVQLGLGKHAAHGRLEFLHAQAFHVVAVEDAHARQVSNPLHALQLRQQSGRLHGMLGLFFGIDAVNHFARTAFLPMSCLKCLPGNWIWVVAA